jgi:regulator of nucleoside diphosphate kinase
MSLPIIITEPDAARLRRLLESSRAHRETDEASLKRLEHELERAQVVKREELPPDVIAMNSSVELEDLEDGEVLKYTLVYPEQADAASGRISILAPLVARIFHRLTRWSNTLGDWVKNPGCRRPRPTRT